MPIRRRLLAALPLACLLGAGLAPLGPVAAHAAKPPAVTARVTVVAAPSTAGASSTLSYAGTVTRPGRLTAVNLTVPAGATGTPATTGGTLRRLAPNKLSWVPTRPLVVPAGRRLVVTVRGLTLPTRPGSYPLAFTALAGGTYLSSGTSALTVAPAPVPPASAVSVTSTPSVAEAASTLTFSGTATRPGRLTSVNLTLPTGSTGSPSATGGTLRSLGADRVAWTPTTPITVVTGQRLSVTVRGLVLPFHAGRYPLAFTALAGSTYLSWGTASVTVAPKPVPAGPVPPAGMPALPPLPMPPLRPGCPARWPSVAEENARPGDGSWVVTSPTTKVAMYASATSAACGDDVALKVSAGKPVVITAYRIGYYQGLGARQVWRSGSLRAVTQPPATLGGLDADGRALHMASAKTWSVTATVHIGADFTPGVYLFKADDGVNATYAPLTVRDDTGTVHELLIQQATATWSAYNDWGGAGFYSGGSTRLTYDRPYDDGSGSGEFLTLERGLVFWAESKGLDVTYWTDEDLHTLGVQLPRRARTLVLPAHDEYYSMPMRQALSQAIAAKVNVLNLGANAVYRKTTYRPGMRDWDIDRWGDWYTYTTWRSLGKGYYEQALLGGQYVCPTTGGDLTAQANWLWDGVAPGTVVPGLIHGEVDRTWPYEWQPAGVQILATGPATCTSGYVTRADVSAFTAPSGARVLNGSTFAWSCFLIAACPAKWGVDVTPEDREVVGRVVSNMLSWASSGRVQVPQPAPDPPEDRPDAASGPNVG